MVMILGVEVHSLTTSLRMGNIPSELKISVDSGRGDGTRVGER